MTTRYDLNGVLSIETDIPIPVPSYYETDESVADADIVLTAGTVTRSPPREETRRIGSRYRWDRATSTLFLEWNLPMDLRCTVTGLGDPEERTVVEMTDQYRKRGETGSLFTSILNVELLVRGYTILHGGCLSAENGGAIVTGWDDMGKTSTSLSMHGRAGLSFMGDDAIVVGTDGSAHAWDRKVGISPYTSVGNIPIPERKRRRIRLKRFARHVPGLGVLHSSRERIDVQGVIGRERTSCEPEYVFFLEGGTDGPNEIGAAEATRRMLETSNADKSLVKHDLVQTYAYLYPPISNLNERRREVFEGLASRLTPVELRSEEKDRYPDWIADFED